MRHAALGLLLAGCAVPAAAQGTWQWEAALTGVGVRVKSVTGPASQKLSGAAFGYEGHILYSGRITLDFGYFQGKLTPASGQTVQIADRDVVEGFAQLGARPLSWLSLRVGPHAWTYTSNAGRQRWFLMEGRVRAQGEIVPEVLSYFELWKVFSANVNVPQGFQSGAGGEGGISLRLRDVPVIPERFPVRIRGSYGIERVRMNGAGRTEVLDRLSLSIGIEHH
jgi:hypothetical protein